MIALNVEMISSSCLPHLVEASALRMLSVCYALMTVRFMCCENISFGSKVIPRVLGVLVGSISLFNLSDRVEPYSVTIKSGA